MSSDVASVVFGVVGRSVTLHPPLAAGNRIYAAHLIIFSSEFIPSCSKRTPWSYIFDHLFGPWERSTAYTHVGWHVKIGVTLAPYFSDACGLHEGPLFFAYISACILWLNFDENNRKTVVQRFTSRLDKATHE